MQWGYGGTRWLHRGLGISLQGALCDNLLHQFLTDLRVNKKCDSWAVLAADTGLDLSYYALEARLANAGRS